MKLHVANWIWIEDRKVLLNRTKGKSVFYLPGGKIDEGETPKEAVVREVKEELDVNLLVESLRLYRVFKGKAFEQANTELIMHAFTCDYKGEICAANEIEEWRFFSYDEYFSLQKKDIVPMGVIVFNYLKKKSLIF